MKNISVIGAGTMGNGIAHVFAQTGFKVNIIDISQESLDKVMLTIAGNLDRMLAKEKITEADKASTLANLTTTTNMISGVSNADLVVMGSTGAGGRDILWGSTTEKVVQATNKPTLTWRP